MFSRDCTAFTLLIICLLLIGIAGCRESDQPTQVAEQQPPAGSPTPVPTQTEAPDTPTSEPTNTPAPTETTIPTASPSPTAMPTETATPAPTETPTPTVEPTLAPTETPVSPPPPEWLSYLNRFRTLAQLPPLSDFEAYTLGSQLHSRYMVVNDTPIAHSQDKNNPLYDEAGGQAAENGNLFATSQIEADYLWSINFWVSAPFHLIGMLEPGLEEVGYGDHNEAVGGTHMAGVLDIRSDGNVSGETVEYPIFFPADGSETWVVRHSLFEWPDPVGSCPGYSRPTGAPIVLQLGDGSLTPHVASHRFAKGDQPLESCLFDETSYRNSDAYAESIGRTILGEQDAIVIIPRNPLPIDETYTVQVEVDGETYTWSFTTRKGPD